MSVPLNNTMMKYISIIFLAVLLTSNLFSQNLNDSLQVFYKFENNFIDSSINNNDLFVDRPQVNFINSSSQYGTSVSFDSTNRPSLRSISNFSTITYNKCAISFWFKANRSLSNRQVIIQGANLGFAALIQNSTNKLHVWFDGSSSGAAQSNAPVVDSLWHNVVFQTDGSKTDLYIDGFFNMSVNEPFFKGSSSLSEYIYLGNTSLSTENYSGELDEVRIYNRLLSQVEIDSLANRNVITTGINRGLHAYYPFESNYVDSIANNDLFVNQGNVPFQAPSPLSNSYISFDSIGRPSIRSINNFRNQNFTQCAIAFWMKAEKTLANRQVIIQGAGLGFGILIAPITNKLHTWFDNGSPGANQSLNSMVDSNWHHIVTQTDGNFSDLYIDGVFNGRINETLYTGSGNFNEYLYLGNTNLGSENYAGALDDLRIYNRTLSQTEITTLAQPPVTTSIQQSTASTAKPTVYPNPNNGEFTVNLANNEINVNSLSIFNLLGENVPFTSQVNNQSISFSIEAKNGLYFLRLVDAKTNKAHFVKVIKQ